MTEMTGVIGGVIGGFDRFAVAPRRWRGVSGFRFAKAEMDGTLEGVVFTAIGILDWRGIEEEGVGRAAGSPFATLGVQMGPPPNANFSFNFSMEVGILLEAVGVGGWVESGLDMDDAKPGALS